MKMKAFAVMAVAVSAVMLAGAGVPVVCANAQALRVLVTASDRN